MATETRFSEQRLHIFRDEFFDSQFMRVLTHQIYGGVELGECFWAATKIKDGNFESWATVWRRLAESVTGKAEKSFANGHLVSAREAYLRASNYYRCAEFMISPGEPLHHEMGQKSRECFRMAGSLFDLPIRPIYILFQDYLLPGYFIPASAEGEKRPTVIVIGGGDSSGEELYFYMGEGARRRGYHSLLVEGPGQRGALHTNPGLVFRRQGHELNNRLHNHIMMRITRVGKGGDAHCASNNLSLMNQIVFDWLDECFSMATGKACRKRGELNA